MLVPLEELSENIEDLRENHSRLFTPLYGKTAKTDMANTKCRTQCPAIQCLMQTRSLIAPHNEQSVPGDVLLALVDRLGSLAETKEAMTPTAPHCCPMVPLILHPARGATPAKDEPFQAAGRIFRLANTVVDQRCALQHKRACPFLNPWGMSGFALQIE